MLLQQLDPPDERLWYAEQALAHGWSRTVLRAQIAKKAHTRQGKATTNFARALQPPQSELAQQALKDPYTFDFLTVGRQAHERVTERELLAHIREFLLELGAGFAFIGNQVKLTVSDMDYFIDLLFYHVRLRCYVVVELKATAFTPEHAGQMNFYLSAVDDLLKHCDDQPSIGLLLCQSADGGGNRGGVGKAGREATMTHDRPALRNPLKPENTCNPAVPCACAAEWGKRESKQEIDDE